MSPPDAKPAAKKRSPGQEQPLHQVAPDAVLSPTQISTILDPFFDTCIAVRREGQQQRSRAAASASAPADAAAATAATREFLTPPLHGAHSPSVVIDDVGDSGAMGAAPPDFGALQDFLGSANSAFVDMVQEMEAEKQQSNEKVVRLNVI